MERLQTRQLAAETLDARDPYTESRSQRVADLAARIGDLSRSRIQALMEEGHVLVNAEPKLRSCKIRGGEQIVLTVPPAVSSENLPGAIPLERLF